MCAAMNTVAEIVVAWAKSAILIYSIVHHVWVSIVPNLPHCGVNGPHRDPPIMMFGRINSSREPNLKSEEMRSPNKQL